MIEKITTWLQENSYKLFNPKDDGHEVKVD